MSFLRYLAHCYLVSDILISFSTSNIALHASQAEEIRVRDGGAPTMNKLDTKRYSCDAPETAMEKDVQVR